MATPRIIDKQFFASARQIAQQTQEICQLRQALAGLQPAESALAEIGQILPDDNQRSSRSA
jgi:hypothetical protein